MFGRGVVLAVATLAVGGVAFAAIPSDGKVNACYAKKDGVLFDKGDVRLIDEGESCRSYETAIAWNQTGPAGPQGVQGPQGPQGPAGEEGAPGPGVKTIAGIVEGDGDVITGTGFTVQRTDTGSYRLAFPAGTWKSIPAITVTPLGINNAVVVPVVVSSNTGSNGSSDVDIVLSSSAGALTLHDNFWSFIAVDSAP